MLLITGADMISKGYMGLTLDLDIKEYVDNEHARTMISRSKIVNFLLKEALKEVLPKKILVRREENPNG